jgi:putative transposase
VLDVVDDFTREALALVAVTSIDGARVVRELDAPIVHRGLAGDDRQRHRDRADLAGGAGMDQPHWRRMALHRPRQADPERLRQELHGPFRDKCLDEEVFANLAEACAVIETWRRDYNQLRPHSAHGGLTSAGDRLRNPDQLRRSPTTTEPAEAL